MGAIRTEYRNQVVVYRPASLCSLAGRYDNPVPIRFLAPTDWSKIPAQVSNCSKSCLVYKGGAIYLFYRRTRQ